MSYQQAPLDLPPAAVEMTHDNFVPAPGNAVALSLVAGWPDAWHRRKLALVGPPGSGKTHLACIWTAASGASHLTATQLASADIDTLAKAPVAVEDVPSIAGNRPAEEALFHLHNLVLSEGHGLLVTGDRPVSDWGLTLPDLDSRMQGTQAAVLKAPDDTLLSAVLAKLFADRQLLPTPDVIPYLVLRMDRSFDAARRIVAELDARSLSAQRRITRPMAMDLMHHSDDPPPGG
ncbi:HdaA/DnaA family protein [Pseudooceanicola aestuarii]|uniref:HdaA/DnaA family protein n=1 Tax=Pseudooceanicola aestuarii TaxID=2697319 RepID=UPI0013D5D506|nr:chromosomal replication initiator DnaA [Pseudooceanicola aestuarii]